MDVSIVIAVRNEEENIDRLADEISTVFEKTRWSWECLWVDDCSQDHTLDTIENLRKRDTHHRSLAFSVHWGQAAALFAGFRASRGLVIATLDGDGQNDPADLPAFIEPILAGETDAVLGYRVVRRDHFIRRISSRIANGFRKITTGGKIRDVGCSTRAFRAECVQCFPQVKGVHRFYPVFLTAAGYRIAELPANHRPRIQGVTKYGIANRLFVGLLDTFGVMWVRARFAKYRYREADPP